MEVKKVKKRQSVVGYQKPLKKKSIDLNNGLLGSSSVSVKHGSHSASHKNLTYQEFSFNKPSMLSQKSNELT